MCGISGIVLSDKQQAEALIQSMNRVQAHRGPDDQGNVVLPFGEKFLAFGHRRLSIIDVSSAGHQPMMDPESGNWITFNGEIYNFKTLRTELESHGRLFITGTDTEVILQGYSQWGTGCISRLRGIFAFGLFDTHRHTLLLARDPMGVKPLYIWKNTDTLIFASEVRAILSTALIPHRLDWNGFHAFMTYGSVQEPFTLVEGIHSLSAGTWMEWNGQVSRKERYWRIPPPERVGRTEPDDLDRQLATHLTDAVQSQLVSDVPIGAFLSGGIDSTAVAALMKAVSGSDVRTFSLVFAESAYDERAYSRLASRYLGTRHVEVELSGDMVHQVLNLAMESFDQPSMDGLNTWFVSRAAREAGLTVALSGLGGDELFAGYNGFAIPLAVERYGRLIKFLPWSFRKMMSSLLTGYSGSEAVRKLADIMTTSRHPYFVTRKLFNHFQIDCLLARNAVRSVDWQLESLDAIENESAGHDPVNRVSALELQTYMRSTLLRDTDQMSMAHALEVRVPLIDPQLVEYLFTLPGKLKLNPDLPKPLLTRPIQNLLPAECIYRPKKGFELPFKEWFSKRLHEEMHDSFCGGKATDKAWPFHAPALADLWQQFETGTVSWGRVWSIFVLRRWLERHGIN